MIGIFLLTIGGYLLSIGALGEDKLKKFELKIRTLPTMGNMLLAVFEREGTLFFLISFLITVCIFFFCVIGDNTYHIGLLSLAGYSPSFAKVAIFYILIIFVLSEAIIWNGLKKASLKEYLNRLDSSGLKEILREALQERFLIDSKTQPQSKEKQTRFKKIGKFLVRIFRLITHNRDLIGLFSFTGPGFLVMSFLHTFLEGMGRFSFKILNRLKKEYKSKYTAPALGATLLFLGLMISVISLFLK